MQNNKIGSGLHNLGNTCFFNAVMQIILYTPSLTVCLSGKKHSAHCNNNGWCIFCSIEKLWEQSKQSRVVSPQGIVSNLRNIFKKFRLGRQEDSHQFLRYLVQGMQDAETGKLGKDRQKNELIISKTMTYEVFGGRMRTFVLCLNCHHKSLTTQRYYDLSIQCQRSNSLQQGLQNYFKVDQLTGSNKYRCDNCKKLSNAKKGFKIISVPSVVTFQFKRFTNSMRKINKLIDYPRALDLSRYMENHQIHEKIQLYGVVVHAGSSASSGHYYAFVKNGNQWFQMNDSNVSRTNEERVLKQQAYLLFYRRVNQTRAPQILQEKPRKENDLLTNINGLNHIRTEMSAEKISWKSVELLKRKQSEEDIQETKRKLSMNIEQLIQQAKAEKKETQKSTTKSAKQKIQDKSKIQMNGKTNIFLGLDSNGVNDERRQTRKSSVNSVQKNEIRKEEIKRDQKKVDEQPSISDGGLEVPNKLERRRSKGEAQSAMPISQLFLRCTQKISLLKQKILKGRNRRALRSVTKLRQFQLVSKRHKFG